MPRASDFPWGQQHLAGTSPFHQYQTGAVAEQGAGKKKRGKHASSKDRNAAKATESGQSGQIAVSPPALRPQSFGGYLPTGFPPVVDNGPQGSITSPVLEALGSNADSAYRTDVWTQSVPVGKSPPTDLLGGMSISGSPSSVAPSHASERGVSHERAPLTDRGVSTSTPPSSPPQAKARPASYVAGMPSQRPRLSSNDTLPRPSFTSHFQQPPLPHHAQAHFYGAPHVDLGLGGFGSHDASKDNVSFTKFDVLRSPASTKGSHSHRIALMGFEDRLDVISLQHHKPKPIGCIDNMNGQLVDAQILTWESNADPFSNFRPLVAVVIHGPKIEINSGPSPRETEEDTEIASSEVLSATPQPEKVPDLGAPNSNPEVHTRVDIYSLRSLKRLTTLFATQSQRIEPGFRGLPAIVPPPIGDLKLAASGNYTFITSITSGEIYVYTATASQQANFQCLGKYWTTVQSRDVRRYSSSSASTDASASPADPSRAVAHPEQPLMTVSSRWLAFVSPGGTGRSSIHGFVPASLVTGKPPGLDSFTAPSKPSVTCAIDSTDAESIFNTVARGVAQEVVKGARWMGDQGLQAWNNYWNKDPSSNSTQNPSIARSAQIPNIPASYFPPTHGLDTQNPSLTDPELVSIVDLSRLASAQKPRAQNMLEPIITFQPPSGCSYISFSPDGLSMMTSSKKGDIQYIWDLKQARHQRTAALVTEHPASVDSAPSSLSPQVRQIARFTRLSSASITDVIWTTPTGERLAVITRNGTVHVLDIPPSAFIWPPPRRLIKQPHSMSDIIVSTTIEKEDSSTSESFLASAWKVAGRAQPMLATLRGRAPSLGNTFSGIGANSIGFASATGVKGGKVVAAGLSKSMGAASGTVSTLRHVGENRLHLSSLAKKPLPGRVCWHIGEKEEPALSVIDGSLFKKYRVSRSAVTSQKGHRSKVSSVIEVKHPIEARLPTIENLRYAAETAQSQKYGGFEEASPQSRGYWALATTNSTSFQSPHPSHSHPLSHAEIETNSPYQPFHSDRRINLFVYADAFPTVTEYEPDLPDPTVSAILSPPSEPPDQPPPGFIRAPYAADLDIPWVFGNDIPVERLNIHYASSDDDLDNDGLGSVIYRETAHTASGSKLAPGRSGEGPVEEVVITTRKRKGKTKAAAAEERVTAEGMTGEDEDFFEDDLEVVDWVGDRV